MNPMDRIGAAATEVWVLTIPPSFRNPPYWPIRTLLSMKAAEVKSIAANLSCSATHGGSLPIKSRVLRAAGFRQEPKAVGGGSLQMSIARDGQDAERSMPPLVVVSFYKFAVFADYKDMRMPLKDLCEKVRISGGIILAPEGINGSICGTQESVQKVLEFIQSDARLKGVKMVESPVTPEEEAIHHGHTSHSPLGAGDDAPFRWDHVRVKLKKEVLIDVRNMYETRIGKFKGAVDPRTASFREFPSWVKEEFQVGSRIQQVDTEDDRLGEPPKLPRVAMYCTGGIRCEKASSFLLSKGFEEVYHLEGGILKYLEDVPESESLWEGECFVFDKRVSVEHGLEQGSFKLCYGCKQPVSDADMESPEWEFGVCCPYCFSTKSEKEKERARARQKQSETWGVIGGPDKGRRNPHRSQLSYGKVEMPLPSSIHHPLL
ncbi:rhodanese-like domain-containing protein 7 isoform X2 [Dendrobium catenatum]|uniref:rhodanese-like domain-containing protein 7 isoform X2 n=1 Tax=Dendrobium catenatum TaxID=906689 RepID=UPI0010A0586B|nr:rhodanese-like domain-containing protein 7 isoform X2 [Dendrobium catenatum]